MSIKTEDSKITRITIKNNSPEVHLHNPSCLVGHTLQYITASNSHFSAVTCPVTNCAVSEIQFSPNETHWGLVPPMLSKS